MKKQIFVAFLLTFTFLGSQALPQTDEYEVQPVHKNERGFGFTLASSGLGVGGFYRFTLPSFFYIGADLQFFVLRDDKEAEFFDSFTGQIFKVNDPNRLFTIPFNIELKKRLFANNIEGNFRPHLLAQGGILFAMNFPRSFRNSQGEEIDPPDEYQFTYNMVFGFGVDVSTKKDYFVGIRTQYRLAVFPQEIALKTNHSAFEIKIEIGGLY